MKQVKIDIPEGYEIDKENSTFELIKFKEIKKQLPKSWEELGFISGYFVSSASEIYPIGRYTNNNLYRYIFKTKEQAEASIALAQLSQLRDVYRQGWTPDWERDGDKCSIVFFKHEIGITCFSLHNAFLSFQSKEIAQEFLVNFHELIIKSRPLMS
jgi:hypothetical protein